MANGLADARPKGVLRLHRYDLVTQAEVQPREAVRCVVDWLKAEAQVDQGGTTPS
ncbi:hypothetical protein M2318_004497 [Metapseudomonas resinovorans]|uniref:hypothetical protein n=1 Tax=Metapseudomonas resinovorans TaxID=53412 RepID=UPI003D235545